MKKINDDKKVVFKALREFGFNHLEVMKKLNKVKSSHQGNYLASLANKKILQAAIYLSSDEGLQRLRKKMVTTQNAAQKYQEFLNAVMKYGNNP
jgi:50S ribosomal subunit-associated GTPase HflX